MARVGIRKLKNNLRYYISLARNGEQVVVTNRGNDVALRVPPGEVESYTRLTQMVKEGIAAWNGGKPAADLKPIQVAGQPVSEMVIEDRR